MKKADGTIKKDTIIYTAYGDDEDNALFDAATTLLELKKKKSKNPLITLDFLLSPYYNSIRK